VLEFQWYSGMMDYKGVREEAVHIAGKDDQTRF
jgi:hypothetical protein